MKLVRLNKVLAGLVVCLFLLTNSHSTGAQQKSASQCNNQALRDFAIEAIDSLENSESVLGGYFHLKMDLSFAEKATTEPPSIKLFQQDGDEQLVSLAAIALKAFARSGYFEPLSSLGGHDVRIVLKQAGETFSIRLESILPNAARARNSAEALSLSFTMYGTNQKAEGDIPIWLKNVRAYSSKDKLVITLEESKQTIHELFRREMKRVAKQECRSN